MSNVVCYRNGKAQIDVAWEQETCADENVWTKGTGTDVAYRSIVWRNVT